MVPLEECSHLPGLLLVPRGELSQVETIGDAFMCSAGVPFECSPQHGASSAADMALSMIEVSHALYLFVTVSSQPALKLWGSWYICQLSEPRVGFVNRLSQEFYRIPTGRVRMQNSWYPPPQRPDLTNSIADVELLRCLCIPCPPIGSAWRIFSLHVFSLVPCGEYSHFLPSHWSRVGNIRVLGGCRRQALLRPRVV
jgi:hypothetical protein